MVLFLIMKDGKRVLFVCTQNWHRSKTAETIFSKDRRFQVKSAGTNAFAETPLSKELIQWPDIIFVMEQRHEDRIKERFAEEIKGKHIINLAIPDRYRYMDPVLISILKEKINACFAK